jgi:hypothetical protein
LMLAGIGAILGLVFSYFAGRSMQALLAGVGPFDPATREGRATGCPTGSSRRTKRFTKTSDW